MNDKEFQEAVGKHLLKEVYEQIREQNKQSDQPNGPEISHTPA